MEGYVQERRRSRLAVEVLEERALLSTSSPPAHSLPSPPPAQSPPLTAYLEHAISVLEALPQTEKAQLVTRLYAVGTDGGAAPDHERADDDAGDRERGEYLRAALLELVANSAADARVAAEGAGESRFASSPAPPPPAPAEAGPAAVPPPREAEARGVATALLRGEAGEAPPPTPPADEVPAEAVARSEESPGAAPVAPPASAEAPSLSARATALLEGSLPLDLPALKHEVDEFFARLTDLGDGGEGCHAYARLGPWLIVMTAGVIEAARGWKKRAARRTSPGDEVIVGPAAHLTEDD